MANIYYNSNFIISGGVSTIYKREASANCIQMGSYNSKIRPSTIWYTDCNNLYGFIMMKRLPQKGIVWMTEEEVCELDPLTYKEDSDIGFILEVSCINGIVYQDTS